MKELQDFAISAATGGQNEMERYYSAKKNLCNILARKAISGDALSQRDRWLIAELLTGRLHPAPKARGKQTNPDNDYRLFMRFCEIVDGLELSESGLNPKKIQKEAYEKLTDEESKKRKTYMETGNVLDNQTIPKAVNRGAYEAIRRKQGCLNYHL